MNNDTITLIIFTIVFGLALWGIVAMSTRTNKKAAEEKKRHAEFLAAQTAEAERREKLRRQTIKSHIGDWGVELCQHLLEREVMLQMTQDMVRLSWGNPTSIDQQEITAKSDKVRWIYGQPRRGARYVWFTDAKVAKIKA